jgi:nitrogen regulatory protein P-II 1
MSVGSPDMSSGPSATRRAEDESIMENEQLDADFPLDCFAEVARAKQVVQIIALVKPFRVQSVLDALGSVPVLGGSVREAMGYGRQKNRLHHYLGSEYNSSFVPKVELSIFVREHDSQAAVRAIVAEARTGRIGDGKILILECAGEFLSW